MSNRDNSGALFVNDRKESDNHPDRTGSCVIDGVEYWMNGWLKKSDKGQHYLSLSFKPKQAAQQKKEGGSANRQDRDEIPFF